MLSSLRPERYPERASDMRWLRATAVAATPVRGQVKNPARRGKIVLGWAGFLAAAGTTGRRPASGVALLMRTGGLPARLVSGVAACPACRSVSYQDPVPLSSEAMADGYHLAQVNIGKLVAPTDAPEVAEFIGVLADINALAEASPGFVWRLADDDSGGSVSIRVFEDDEILINMSVWESIETLWHFVYKSHHVDYFRRRREWFIKFPTLYLALWWIPAGTIPTTADAKERLAHLEAHGPTPYAFTFKQRFEPAEAAPLAAS
jgi:Domain of unknown function (DUF3291)